MSKKKIAEFLLDFPKFCNRILDYKHITIQEGDYQPNNNKVAWGMFLQNEQKRYFGLNNSNGGLDTDFLDFSEIQWEFVSPWITRYDNALPSYKEEILSQFVSVMKQKYFNAFITSETSEIKGNP